MKISYYHKLKFFQKVRQFWWCHSKFWPACTLLCLISFFLSFFKGVGGDGVKQNAPGVSYPDFLKWKVFLSRSVIIIKWTWVFFSQNLQFDLPSPTIRHKRIIMKCRNFCDKKAALMMPFENWNYPYYREVNFYSKNKVVLLTRFEVLNCPYYHELKFSKKYDRVTWKFTLPLWSRDKTFSKINQCCWSDLKI